MEQTAEWQSRTKSTGETTWMIHHWDEIEECEDQKGGTQGFRLAAKQGWAPKNEEDLSAMKKSVMSNRASMNDGSFAGVGGALVRQLAATELSAILDGRGLLLASSLHRESTVDIHQVRSMFRTAVK